MIPIGLIGSVIVVAKLIMQTLWMTQIEGDESVPRIIHTGQANIILKINCII
jgi:hypothetical protein